ncbi:3'-5' exonuclease [Streptomyces sp. NPDC001220]
MLDTETTGIHAEARIVEIGVQRESGDVVMSTLVDPGEPIPPEATAVHGITNAMVSGVAPPFAEIADQLTAALTGKRVVIYRSVMRISNLPHRACNTILLRCPGRA